MPGRSQTRPLRRAFPPLAVALVACATLLFLAAPTPPIVVWDEGRIVVAAMEMRHSGISAITTYHFRPDVWSTKPPLLVWLITASMALFGPSEGAVRLPSLLASLGTLLLVIGFVRRVSGSLWAALLAGMILATSVGFFGEHGAHTADYEALLCFFTTAYLLILFFAIHRRRPSARWLLVAGIAAACALMTKAVAGALPGAGLVLYLVVTGRWRRPLTTGHYYTAATVAVLPFLLFCAVWEAMAPGYVWTMFYNNVTGRFSEALEAHSGPLWYYPDVTFFAGLFSFGPATILAPFAVPVARGKTRQGLIFALCIALGQLVAVTATATKLSHYYFSAYPFLAIAVALAVHATLRALATGSDGRTGSPIAAWGLKLAVALVVARGIVGAVEARQVVLPEREHYPRARYGEVLRALAAQTGPIRVLEAGFAVPDDPHYAPELLFHMMVARESGRSVEQAMDAAAMRAAPPGTILATCDARFVAALRERGPDLIAIPGCAAVR